MFGVNMIDFIEVVIELLQDILHAFSLPFVKFLLVRLLHYLSCTKAYLVQFCPLISECLIILLSVIELFLVALFTLFDGFL